MKKLFVFLLLVFVVKNVVDKKSFVGYSWPHRLVAKCQKATTVFFVTYPEGGVIGSGVFISKTGIVLTAAHLFTHDKYEKIQLVTSNGRIYDMTLLAINTRTDLALVEPVASAQDFEFAKIQRSPHVYIGQDVLVIGHPFSNYFTVTAGIISRIHFALHRLTKVIETDAVVNPGNSGGPMFNTKGEVVGIVSAMYVNVMGPTGIGIAVHLHDIHAFLKEYEDKKIPSQQIKRYKLEYIK